ncbi:DGQHR domain-containing protein [Colwellia sp. Bg11-28]|uniref:DGQHR domain-containing protein n=1 Tax=Colwellia sp. Bg11-28 TaxID=2058305 RepID=UPI0012FEDDD2|nr:DNA sulfur modification protein DndB [Colwellia sp. Bg11-28]
MKSSKLVLPCLKGKIGSWDTYSCMMRLSDINDLIGFAHDLHRIKKLSTQIQRELKLDRGKEISDYLLNNKDRFFNSLVVAVFNGEPSWHEISNLRPSSEEALQLEFPDFAEHCIGFLSVNRKETFFALDGQHRVEGIKQALKIDPSLGEELLNVIVVRHLDSDEGIKQSRRLFTTLNKKAEKVSKDAIIALDEDDIPACITRWLIEESHFTHFKESNISFKSGRIQPNDNSSITSIVNIYDNVKKLVSFVANKPIEQIDDYKPKSRKEAFDFVCKFYNLTFFYCEELRAVSSNLKKSCDFRNNQTGGHFLFRPVGWDIYVDVILRQMNKQQLGLEVIIKQVFTKNLYLNGPILGEAMWSVKGEKILPRSGPRTNKIEKAIFE